MKEENMGRTVSYTIDLDNPPPVTDEQKAQLARLREMKDEDIDYSDIPPQTGIENWRRPGRLRDVIAERIAERERQAASGVAKDSAPTQTTVSLESDVLSFFKESGDVSPRRINAALREYMQAHRKSA